MEWLVLLLMCFQVIVASPPSISKIFRTDYVYNKKTDAFYKLHIDGVNFSRAKQICLLEGGNLLTPSNEWEFRQIHAMVKMYPDIDNVWMGDDGQNHSEEAEKVVIFDTTSDTERVSADIDDYSDSTTRNEDEEKCEVINQMGDIKTDCCHCSYVLHPFICKVEAKDAPYDETCGVYETGYEYVANVGSCYKIPRAAVIWNTAYAECQAVGSHLVVINSEAEHLAVKTIMQKSQPVHKSYHSAYFHAGFRTRGESREFVTIFNQTLEEAGYAQWSATEPNNWNNSEYCGSLFKGDGKLNDLNCNLRYGYICEKEIRR